jgi:hypothetical protein
MKNVFFQLVAVLMLAVCLKPSHAQVLEVTPVFPTIDDVVTIVFNAAEGNGALIGETPVYAHTGVITTASETPTDWKFVIGEWGTEDSRVLMTDLGGDRHEIVIDIDEFYGFPGGTEVLKLAFVFRNADGSIVGRASDGSDIFYDVYSGNALVATFLTPDANLVVDENDEIVFSGQASTEAELKLYDNGIQVAAASNATNLMHTITVTGSGTHEVVFEADNGGSVDRDTTYYTINGPIVVEDPPGGLEYGANYTSNSSVLLQFYAPDKEYVYVLSDLNDWRADQEYYMKKSQDGNTWWLEIDGLTPNKEYAYQFWVDGEIRVADPYATIVLDQFNDSYIDESTFPGLYDYPFGKTSGFVSLMRPGATPFDWQNTDFQRPQQNHLVIYELLLRDFLEEHNYPTLIDTLTYFKKMGINAIELMPPGEFEGNESWGYNPSYHMALDKYYGRPDDFKRFVDACHGMGIAVIVDMVLNHGFGQNPYAQLYWDAANNTVAENNPFFNIECPTEPYCWGNDFNHFTEATQYYVDRVNKHWLEEYNIDGFRFDFTFGFTQTGNGYDPARIAVIKRMADVIWATTPGAYVILEHWSDPAEETELINYQMMVWVNVTHPYQEAAMGWTDNSNFAGGLYSTRGWAWQHLVSYMESHDEERMSYKTQEYGNSSGDYNTKNPATAMARNELCTAFFMSQPGPRMIWQFGELGYDKSINYCPDGTIDEDCRVTNKPILWEYYEQDYRKRLYDVYCAMGYMRTNYPQVMNSGDHSFDFGGPYKRFNLYHPDMDVVVMGNFGVDPVQGLPNFPYTGTWYDYFGGFAIEENNLGNEFLLEPGEYRVYTSIQLPKPELTEVTSNPTSVFEVLDVELEVFPNPTASTFQVNYNLKEGGDVKLLVLDGSARTVQELFTGQQVAGMQSLQFDVSKLAAGNYYVLIEVDGVANAFPLVKSQ